MNSLIKIFIFILSCSSLMFATADGPDYLDVRGVALNDVLWMHPVPNYQSQKIGKIPYNARCLKNLGYQGKWSKVNYRGTIGWVNGRFLMEAGNCSQTSYVNYSQQKKPLHQKFTKQMLQGVVLTRGDHTIKFRPPSYQSFDGDIIFHFNSNAADDTEVLSYRIVDGKIIYYSYDGSTKRLTLQSVTSSSWTILEEEDMDGNDPKYGFGQAIQKTYQVLSPSLTSNNYQSSSSNASANDEIEQLYMQIYGRLDTRVAARRDYLKEVNIFIDRAATLLIRKYTIELELHNLKLYPEKGSVKKSKFQKQLASMQGLNGQIVRDYDGNKHRTMQELEKAFQIGVKKSMEMQRNNYEVESEIAKLSSKLQTLLDAYGTPQQKKDISHAENMRLNDDRNYYDSLLGSEGMICMSDKQKSQKKFIFNSELLVVALLAKKYVVTFVGTDKPFYNSTMEKAFKKLKAKSQKAKEKFRREYLY